MSSDRDDPRKADMTTPLQVPELQLFPALDTAVEAALRASIERFGVIQPITIDQQGRVLDGHHRMRIASQLGVPCPTITRQVADEDEAREIARTLNMDRRHLEAEQRRVLAADLREQGHSFRAIGGALGVDAKTVRNDLDRTGDKSPVPDRVTGLDGKSRPSTRPARAEVVDRAREAFAVADEPAPSNDETEAIADNVEAAWEDGPDNPANYGLGPSFADKAIAGCVESKRVPQPQAKPDLGDGLSHPARYSAALYPIFEQLLARHVDGSRVLDPFAGVGGVHELQRSGYETVGIELEAEYAAKHPDTICGDATDLPFEDDYFDAIVTSPTYGNRLADSYNATDPEARRSYHFDLGHELSPNNTGAMQWGPRYRMLHRDAWPEAVRCLRPGGVFLLNIKDHIRNGERQYVAGWHVSVLCKLGMILLEHEEVATSFLRQGANSELRLVEMVYTFRKGDYE